MSDLAWPEFQTLFQVPGLPRFDIPKPLELTYGDFGLSTPLVYANFVSSLDGIVALPDVPRSSALISRGDPSDRFVVALLRAAADAVVIGAGTFRDHSGPWTAEKAYPDAAEIFAELRRREGLRPRPTLVIVTGSGDLGGSRSWMQDTIVFTTSEGAKRLSTNAAGGAEIVPLSATGPIDVHDVIQAISDRGLRRILTEGGPKLMGELLKARIVDELFLTMSPVVAGGGERQPRPTFAAGVDLLPIAPLPSQLLSVHRSHAYLFLRYSLPVETLDHPSSERSPSWPRRSGSG